MDRLLRLPPNSLWVWAGFVAGVCVAPLIATSFGWEGSSDRAESAVLLGVMLVGASLGTVPGAMLSGLSPKEALRVAFTLFLQCLAAMFVATVARVSIAPFTDEPGPWIAWSVGWFVGFGLFGRLVERLVRRRDTTPHVQGA